MYFLIKLASRKEIVVINRRYLLYGCLKKLAIHHIISIIVNDSLRESTVYMDQKPTYRYGPIN